MIESSNLVNGLANIFHEIRVKNKLSKAKIANKLYIDEKTWARYESGESSPSVPEFIRIFSELDENALFHVLRLIYPTTYGNLNLDASTQELRQAVAHYFLHVASDKSVREWSYIVYGEHGSNIEPQLQEFCAIDHLPMDYRVAIAKNIVTFYRLAQARGEIISPEHIAPDIELLIDGIIKGEQAANNKRNSYTTASK